MRKNDRNNNINTRKKNPLRISFLTVTLICCLTLGIVFTGIYYAYASRTQKENYQKRVDMLANDLDSQIEMFEQIALKIAITKYFQPYFFEENILYEQDLLEHFKQYSNYSILADECFLYYGGKKLYLTSGYLNYVEVYLKNLQLQEKEKAIFMDGLYNTFESNTDTIGEMNVFQSSQETFYLIPFGVRAHDGKDTAVIGFHVKNEKLQERFRMLSGDAEGNFALYNGTQLLYSSQPEAIVPDQRSVYTENTIDGRFAICYSPGTATEIQSATVFMLFLIALAEIIFMIFVAFLYADKTYAPFENMSRKYSKELDLERGQDSKNALDEICYMMNELVQKNTKVSEQIEYNNKILQGQFLRSLIDGTLSDNAQLYLDNLQMKMPGPYYYITSMMFQEEHLIDEEFLTKVKEEIESLTYEDKRYVYAVCDFRKSAVYSICSVNSDEEIKRLNEELFEKAKEFSCHPMMGIGSIQLVLSRLSASWLESMDDIHRQKQNHAQREVQSEAYDSYSLERIFEALDRDDIDAALENLENYMNQMKQGRMSLLMQKYMISDFASELNRQAKKYGIELSKKGISQVISASDAEGFELAARELIQELYEKIKISKSAAEENESYRVFQYVNAHYAEYDMSLEKTAEDLNISDKVVRAAILKHTGKMYKDYIIFLRIEFAKTLLENDKLSVSEVCQMVGYSNVPYFIKLFKKTTGVTPAKFKQGLKGIDK